MLESVAARHLLEVLHTAFDERLIREVRDVAIEPSARTLGMAHLAEHTTIGARDALDGQHRCRWDSTERSIDGLPSRIDVLRRHLAVCDELLRSARGLPQSGPHHG